MALKRRIARNMYTEPEVAVLCFIPPGANIKSEPIINWSPTCHVSVSSGESITSARVTGMPAMHVFGCVRE